MAAPPGPSRFPYFPPNPQQNPNPSPNFFSSYSYHPQYPPTATTIEPPPSQPPPPPLPPQTDLPTALSTLKHLIQFAETTLSSFLSLLPVSASTSTSGFGACPFNPHHLIPPPSLFRHWLRCPAAPIRLDPSLLQFVESLRYPRTLQSSNQLLKDREQSLQTFNLESELYFSLDDYHNHELTSNFFYLDCPGVVSSNELYGNANPNHMLTLPRVLCAECANFIVAEDKEIKGFVRNSSRILPSELSLIRRATEAWNDCTTVYSYSVLRAILCSDTYNLSDMREWVLVNSPIYGIVIDEPMTDHLVLLLRLCSKAIVREAFGLANSLYSREIMELDEMNISCPVLHQVLRWLASQLSILYGEANGKIFAMTMLKQWVLHSSLNSLVFPVMEKTSDVLSVNEVVDGKVEESFEKDSKSARNYAESASIDYNIVFVSQVAAAVAALHERSLLEEKIISLRRSQPRTAFQRVAEHAYISTRAEDERQKRSDYRPILEHDSILWQRSFNQETGKIKTREELLAEERDYKRRRMSYRGKKLKRTTTQIMRDIIEDHMDKIKQAVAVDCVGKRSEEIGMLASEPSSMHNSLAGADNLKESLPMSSEVTGGQPHVYRKHSHSHGNNRSSRFDGEYPEDNKRRRQDYSQNYGHPADNRSIDRQRHNKERYAISLDGQQSSRCTREMTESSCQELQDDARMSRKYFSQNLDRNHSRSHEWNSRRREQSDHYSKAKNKQTETHKTRKSDSIMHHDFDDRYDPSSRDMSEDDVYWVSK